MRHGRTEDDAKKLLVRRRANEARERERREKQYAADEAKKQAEREKLEREVGQLVASHPEAGVIGPKLENPDGSLQFSCRRFPNPLAALFRNTPLGKLFPNNRFTREYLMQDWTHDGPREVDWVSGAALLAREELLSKIGFLDPEYFMYCEDVDYCWRAWDAGYKVVYVPNSVIMHKIGSSTDKAPNRMIGRFHSSMLRFYRKNMLPKRPLVLRPFAYVGAATAIGLRASLFITKNKIDNLKRKWTAR
jgi:GT2 family glycosyltransferase